MSKRKFDNFEYLNPPQKRRADNSEQLKKHSLDSDEEDEIDESTYKLDQDEIEGEEEGTPGQQDGIRLTAFNMNEEMEEGHFDRDGHFIWKNEAEVRDNWLDNIDWQRIDTSKKINSKDEPLRGLGDDSDSDNENFDSIPVYKEIFKFMKPKETLNKTLQRLAGDTHKLSSVERLKRKKAGTLNNNEDVIKVTELANKLLTETGNMDIYQETYETISSKIKTHENKKNTSTEPALNMFDDDFESNEQKKLNEPGPSNESNKETNDNKTMWEYKLQHDKDEIFGPYSTEQMSKWVNEGHFKSEIWVRKCNEQTNFYSSKRIDFELYL